MVVLGSTPTENAIAEAHSLSLCQGKREQKLPTKSESCRQSLTYNLLTMHTIIYKSFKIIHLTHRYVSLYRNVENTNCT